MKIFEIHDASVTSLDIPDDVEVLDCWGCTGLTALPELPASLTVLDCWGCTGLTALPELPDSLTVLYCSDCPGLTEFDVPNGCKVWR